VRRRLAQPGFLTWAGFASRRPLAALIPSSPSFAYAGREVSADRNYILSRFAYIRRQHGETVVESPLAHGRVVLHDGRVAVLLHALAAPGRVMDLASRCPALSPEEITLLLTLLLNAAVLVELTDRGTSHEDEGSALQTWEFHDLLFHA